MCGIAGFNWLDKKMIKEMADSIFYRGPDQSGYFFCKNFSFGHRRLSIIDLSERGRQPMKYKNAVIVFNGEIYNFKDLRKELEQKGHRFRSKTDTEVILHAYLEWGEQCVRKFNGMWAFCIFDSKKKILFLSRDRFGVKPLYYFFDKKRFIFASELKAITKHKIPLIVNRKAINFYFYQKYIGSNLTIFNNCFKLEPSHNLVFDLKNRTIRLSKYYDLEKEIEAASLKSLEERINLIRGLLGDAVEKRLVADVPVGSFLSGGLDSSLISAIIAQRHKDFKTFSIGFKEKSFDELPFSKIVSEHIRTKHYYEYQTINEDIVKEVIEKLDEPFGDSSIIPTYLLSKIARSRVTVSLSGDAGDEVFGGYDTYLAYKISKKTPFLLIKFLRNFSRLILPSDKKVTLSFKIERFLSRFNEDNLLKRHLDWMAQFNDCERKELLERNYLRSEIFMNIQNRRDLLSLQLNDMHNYLSEDILKKVDAASMLNSLEVRTPYLDYRLVPLVLSLPEKYKIRKIKTKWLLKKIATGYLPKKIINRPKRGFSVPISKWIRESELIKSYLINRVYFTHNLLNYDFVVKLYAEHILSKKDNARQLWLVFVFNYWMAKHGRG